MKWNLRCKINFQIYSKSLRRLSIIANHTKEAHIASCLEWCGFEDYLTKEENEKRKQIRQALETEVAPVINKYIEKTEFPFELKESLKKLGICGTVSKGYGSPGLSPMMTAAYIELFRVDASVATHFFGPK